MSSLRDVSRRSRSMILVFAVLVAVLAVVAASNAASTAAPKNTSPPTLSGTPTEGSTLTADPGTYSGTTPITYIYQFRRCDKTGGSCSDIGGTTTQKIYTLTSADVGNTVRVQVRATNSDGSTTATSVPTAVIKRAPTSGGGGTTSSATGCPSGSGPINVSQLKLPALLQIDGQSSSPSTITRSTSTLVLRFHVSACSGRDVSGALVYATAVPFEQFNVPPEAATDSSGYATLTLHMAGHFPASAQQQLLAVFVRARKPGDPITGGIAARLLVSFPVRLH